MADRHLADLIDNEPAFRTFVRGYLWNARMKNGALFQVWTSDPDLGREEARQRCIAKANGDLTHEPDETGRTGPYGRQDIQDLWRSRA